MRIVASMAEEAGLGFQEVIIEGADFSKLPVTHHISTATYYRFLIQDMQIESNRVLYLDSDIVINGNISSLFDGVDMDGYYVAAVENTNFDRHEELMMNRHSNYFNAGIMLINLSLWKKEDIKTKAIDFVRNHPEAVRWLDQCALNAVIDGKWLPLPPEYNLQTSFFEKKINVNTFTTEALEYAKQNPKIVH